MTKYVSATDTAKAVRKALKDAFPGVKFSVRTDKYAGGASIRVKYTDGPAEKDVEQVAKQFAGSTFDGMTDMKTHRTHVVDGEEVQYAADFVFVDRHMSPEAQEHIENLLCDLLHLDHLDQNAWFTPEKVWPIAEAIGDTFWVRDGVTGYALVRTVAQHPDAVAHAAA